MDKPECKNPTKRSANRLLSVYHTARVCARIRLLMRRGVSIAVLAVILTSVFGPTAQAQSSSVPACCRAGGKHHCNESMGPPALDGFKSGVALCPYRCQASVISKLVALTATRHSTAVFVLNSRTARPSNPTCDSCDRKDAHKRGPPTGRPSELEIT